MSTERGSASIIITLEDGNIVVLHGQDRTELARFDDAPEGTWNKLWDQLLQLGFRRHYK